MNSPYPAAHPDTPPPPTRDEITSAEELCAIGLDVGGTKIAGGLVSFPEGKVLARQTLPTLADRGGQEVLDDVVALAETLAANAAALGLTVRCAGIGVAELVDRQGRVTSGQTIAWSGLPVEAALGHIAQTVVVESDVRAAALAEAAFGAGRLFDIFAYVTVGTGISHTLVQGGRPYAGARGNALVLASSPYSSRCPHCGETLHPILEEIAAGPALVAQYNHRHGERRASHLTQGQDVLVAAAAGDPAAIEVVTEAGAALGNGVGLLVNIVDPEALVIGGGLGLAGGLYWSAFISSLREHIWSEASRELPVIPAALGLDAGLVGAAASAWLRGQK